VTNPQARLVNQKLLTALAHPTRVHAVIVLNERTASPAELAKELQRSVRHVAYHLEVLEELGCVELASTEPASGGRVVEHFYRATVRPWFDQEAWEQMDESETMGLTLPILSLMSEDIAQSMVSGTFNDSSNHISRTPMVVDDDGWDETVTLLNSTLEELIAIQGRVSNRSTAETETILTKVEIIQFRSPPPQAK
jgi:predicted ArsR family transcriptional regulator